MLNGGSSHPVGTKWISWELPPNGWIKMNTDSASLGNPGAAGCGGVFMDASGTWKGGFIANIGYCSALAAELWAVLHGLRFAKRKGFKQVIIELDSLEVINMLHSGSWTVRVKHVYREGDRLALSIFRV